MKTLASILFLGLLFTPAILLRAQSSAAPDAAKAVATLQSAAATELEKDEACRALARVGAAEAVPALAALLGDPHLDTLARNALAAIPDPAAGAALRAALATLKGRALIGVIAALGNRRDREAIPALSQLLDAPDAAVAGAAASALARIGGADVPPKLLQALAAAPAPRKPALADAVLRCAADLGAAGKKTEALALYDKLCAAADLPAYVVRSTTLAAWRERGAAAVPQVSAALNSTDWSQVSLGLQAARAIPGEAMTQALLGALDGAAPEKQVLIVKALADRSEASIVLPALLQRAQQGEPAVRVEVLHAVARFADAKAAPDLFALAADPQPEVAAAAQDLLAALPGRDLDEAVIARLDAADPRERLLALEAADKRQLKPDGARLIKLAADPERKIRLAALRLLGHGGGAEVLEPLQAMLMKGGSGELGAIEDALRAIAVRSGNAQAMTAKLLAGLPQAAPPQRCVLLRLIGVLGDPAGLNAIRAASGDADPQVREAAFRALCGWPAATAAEDLLKIAQAPEGGTRKILALRGYIRLIGASDVTGDRKPVMCREAAALAQGEEEKKQLLSVMQDLPDPAVLRLVMTFAAAPETRNEAEQAALAIAEKMTSSPGVAANARGPIIEALTNIIRTSGDEAAKRRARAVLVKINGGR